MGKIFTLISEKYFFREKGNKFLRIKSRLTSLNPTPFLLPSSISIGPKNYFLFLQTPLIWNAIAKGQETFSLSCEARRRSEARRSKKKLESRRKEEREEQEKKVSEKRSRKFKIKIKKLEAQEEAREEAREEVQERSRVGGLSCVCMNGSE